MLVRNPNQVLSFGLDPDTLRSRESILRDQDLDVISVRSGIQAHYEIELGRRGVLLICSTTPHETTRDLTERFRRNCPDGRIILLANDTQAPFGVMRL
jgi:hypothetical protein